VARIRDRTGTCRVLVKRPDGKRTLGRPRCRYLDNVKMYR